jgi:hypothetical protein
MKIEIEVDEFQFTEEVVSKSIKESIDSVGLDLDGDEDLLKALKLVYMFYTGDEYK